jgi:hypothetical protein
MRDVDESGDVVFSSDLGDLSGAAKKGERGGQEIEESAGCW